MDADGFRRLALELPGSSEGSHQDHPDFRAGGKIFASLGPDGTWGMVKLNPEQQAARMLEDPALFRPASGAWGRGGATIVELRRAKVRVVREVLRAAWESVVRTRGR